MSKSRIFRRLAATLSILVAALTTPPTFAAPEDLDATFGTGGVALGRLGEIVQRVALQADGKIVALTGLRLLRFQVDGTPDPTFGDGTGVADLSPLCAQVGLYSCPGFAALTLQPDGKIVIAGSLGGASGVRVARFTVTGQLDPSFGDRGLSTLSPTYTVAATAVTVLSNGDILVAGASLPATALDSGPSLLAFRTDGSLDAAFGQGGQVNPEQGFYGRYSAIGLQGDGKVVVVGTHLPPTGVDMLVARYLPNGQLDTAFGVGGKVINPVQISGLATFAYAAKVQPNGRILLAGAAVGVDSLARPLVSRLNADGTLDTTFGRSGFVLVQYAQGVAEWLDNAAANAVLLQPDGKIVLVGTVGQQFPQLHAASFDRIGIARFDADGSPDITFAGGGSTTIWTGFGAAGYDVVLRADGRLVIGGAVEPSPPIPANDPFVPGRYANVFSSAVLQIEGGTSDHPSPLHQVRAVEYYDANFDHYFVTAMPFEIAALDTSSQSQGWSRTGLTFKVVTEPSVDLQTVCRFFSGQTFAPKSSHFYTPYPQECAEVQQNPGWIYEGGVFFLQLPIGTPGSRTCPGDDPPLYRLYNNGQGGAPNHRYTDDLTIFNQMLAQGWIFEGEAQTKVFACLPPQ